MHGESQDPSPFGESVMAIAIDAITYESAPSAVVREPHHERTGAPLNLRLSKGERHFRSKDLG